MSDANNKIRRALLLTAMACLAVLSIPVAATAAPSPVAPAMAPVPGHKHDWQRESKRKWVKPVQKRVMVGKDKNGKPVYEMKTVKPGRWEIEYKSRCRKCGKTKKG